VPRAPAPSRARSAGSAARVRIAPVGLIEERDVFGDDLEGGHFDAVFVCVLAGLQPAVDCDETALAAVIRNELGSLSPCRNVEKVCCRLVRILRLEALIHGNAETGNLLAGGRCAQFGVAREASSDNNSIDRTQEFSPPLDRCGPG
jgi:hypothetical protein